MKSKKVRIFIYSLVAWFVGMAVIIYNFAVSYAASFGEDITVSDWHVYKADGTQLSEMDSLVLYDDYAKASISASDLANYKYTESAIIACQNGYNGADNTRIFDFQFASNSEIVIVLEPKLTDATARTFNFSDSAVDKPYSFFLSLNNFFVNSWASFNATNGQPYELVSGTADSIRSNVYYLGFSISSYAVSEFAIKSGKMKVFNTFAGAKTYLLTGDDSDLAWQGKSKEYDGDNIYLNDFQMIVHDSNAYSAYYLEFKYTIPEQLRDAASLQLQIEEQYDWTITGLSSLVAYPRTFSGNDYIDLLQYPTGFKLYLDDINVISQSITDIPIASTVSRRAVIGSELAFDTSGISIGGLGGETIVKVTNSKLYLTCYVIANNKFGVNYTGSVDFVSGFNDMSSFTPDSSGNYKYNGDLKNQGHYYTDVATDAAGNVTYNYYYYGDDNSKTEISAKDSADNTLTVVPVPGQNGSIINNITMPDHIFVNVSGSSGGGSSGGNSDVGNVTIEDDDLSFNSLRDSIKDGYGLIDDTDTGVKGDGLIAMLSDLFGYLPAKFVGLIMLGTSSVVGIAVLRMIFKR